MKQAACLFLALLLLAGCGFRPLYTGDGGGALANDGPIAVEEVAGRSGYRLRQSLVRELSTGLPGIEDGSVLTIDLQERISRAALLPDGAVSRSFYEASGAYVLQTSAGPISGKASASVPFGATNSPYTDVSAQTYAAERAMEELSRRIVSQLRIQVQNEK